MSDVAIFEADTQRGAPENLAFSNITRYTLANIERRFKFQQFKQFRRIASPENMGSLKRLCNSLLLDPARHPKKHKTSCYRMFAYK